MFHSEASNPEYTEDIIVEFGTMLKVIDIH